MTEAPARRSGLHQAYVALVFVLGLVALADSLYGMHATPTDYRWLGLALLTLISGAFTLAWAKQIGGPSDEYCSAITFDDAGDGRAAKEERAALLEAALVAAVDHGPQAPSIAVSRMAVTCGLGLNGAMASAINVLDDVHGGAGQRCMELYRDVAREEESSGELGRAVEAVLGRHAAAHRELVPGFGHRFHPVDPRAVKLLALVDGRVDERDPRLLEDREDGLPARRGVAPDEHVGALRAKLVRGARGGGRIRADVRDHRVEPRAEVDVAALDREEGGFEEAGLGDRGCAARREQEPHPSSASHLQIALPG